MLIRLNIEQDWDAAEDPEEYSEEYDSPEKAEQAWNNYAHHYATGNGTLQVKSVDYKSDEHSVKVEVDDLFSDFDFEDVLGAAREALDKGGWVSLCDYVNAKEEEARKTENVRRATSGSQKPVMYPARKPRVEAPNDDGVADSAPELREDTALSVEELVAVGYDKVVVYKKQRWIADAADDETYELHRVEGDKLITESNVPANQVTLPRDAREAKQYAEDTAATFCGDTCPKCGTRIRMANTTKHVVKTTTMMPVSGLEDKGITEALHQDEGEILWNWTCPECGTDGEIRETFHMYPFAQKYEKGDMVMFEGKEWEILTVEKDNRYIIAWTDNDTYAFETRTGIRWDEFDEI